jgi:hypothetical protein
LLENLTGLPVPITKGMGTRFPIEINLIEDPERFQITASIIPSRRDGSLSDADVTRMHKLYNQPMTQVEFEDLLREVRGVVKTGFNVNLPLGLVSLWGSAAGFCSGSGS